MSYARFISSDVVSSSISVMPKRARSGLKVIRVYSSPFLFSVICINIQQTARQRGMHTDLWRTLGSHVVREDLLVLFHVLFVGGFDDCRSLAVASGALKHALNSNE
jgi:hypothetical protein